jgi:cyclin-dependent kinase regulatory subunit CKS1
MPHYPDSIIYSDRYTDDEYEYRNIILPKTDFKKIKPYTVLKEEEWRKLGIQV